MGDALDPKIRGKLMFDRSVSRRMFVAGATALALAACDRRSGQNQRVSVGISPFQDTLLPLFGQSKGWYKEAGLDVDFKILGWTEIQEALSSGAGNRIDIGINNESSVIATYNRNTQLRYLYGFNTFDDGFGLLARGNGGIRPLSTFLAGSGDRSAAIRATALQLKGKTVVTTSNTDMEQGVAAAARQGGLDFKRYIKIVNLAPDDGLAAFLSGTGDAYIGGLPQRVRGVKEGLVEILTGLDLGPAPINGYVGTREFWEKSPEVIVKLIETWFRIVTYINQNLDEGARTIVDILNKNAAGGFSVDDFKGAWNKTEHFMASANQVEQEIMSPSGKNYWKRRWDDCNTYFKDVAGSIPANVTPDQAFLMEQVQKRLLGS